MRQRVFAIIIENCIIKKIAIMRLFLIMFEEDGYSIAMAYRRKENTCLTLTQRVEAHHSAQPFTKTALTSAFFPVMLQV